LHTDTLVDAAVAGGLKVALVGKSGPVYLQDRKRQALLIDEKLVSPLSFAQTLERAGFELPKATTHYAYPNVAEWHAPNADPTHFDEVPRLDDHLSSDPQRGVTTPFAGTNTYFMHVLLDYVWPVQQPQLTIVWLRDPDATEHAYGPGSAAHRDALHDMDRHFAAALAKLDALGWRDSTNVISDVGSRPQHSVGPLATIRCGR